MDFLSRIKTAYTAVTGGQIYSRYDMQRLAQFTRSKQGLRLTAQLLQQTDTLTKKDVGMWRQAWQMAINVDNPQRALLYDIYTDNLIDLHLQGCISQRVGMVKRNKYRLVGKDGKEDEKATDLLRKEWFDDYCTHVLFSRYWGHSLIQFGDVVKTSDGMKFDGVELVPRKHVCPEHGVLLKTVGEDWHCGIPYREGEFSQWCLEAGGKTDLGLLLSCSPQCSANAICLAFGTCSAKYSVRPCV